VSAVRIDDAWQVKAACRGPQAAVFFPPSHFERKDEKEARETRAKAICQLCSVKEPCLEFAIRIRPLRPPHPALPGTKGSKPVSEAPWGDNERLLIPNEYSGVAPPHQATPAHARTP